MEGSVEQFTPAVSRKASVPAEDIRRPVAASETNSANVAAIPKSARGPTKSRLPRESLISAPPLSCLCMKVETGARSMRNGLRVQSWLTFADGEHDAAER